MTRPRTETTSDLIRNLVKDVAILKRGHNRPRTGEVVAYAGDVAPTYALLCQGQNVSRTEHDRLFAILGTKYGAGDGSTTFGLPDLRKRVPVGHDSGDAAFDTIGETGGAAEVTLTVAQIPAHDHRQRFSTVAIAAGGGGSIGGMTSSGGNQLGVAEQITGQRGDGLPHPNMPPYVVMNYIIYT